MSNFNISMFTITGLDETGTVLTHVGEEPKFYALNCYDIPIAYFTSVQAIWGYLELMGYSKP